MLPPQPAYHASLLPRKSAALAMPLRWREEAVVAEGLLLAVTGHRTKSLVPAAEVVVYLANAELALLVAEVDYDLHWPALLELSSRP